MLTLALISALLAASLGLYFDLRRRRLPLMSASTWRPLQLLDVGCVSATIAFADGLFLWSPRFAAGKDAIWTTATLGVTLSALVLVFLWQEGERQVQLQRPSGIVFGEWAILIGASLLLCSHVSPLDAPARSGAIAAVLIVVGAAVLGGILPEFLGGREEHRILDRISTQGEFAQPEYASATEECPFPSRWRMLDAQSAEIEVLDFLGSLVATVKPELIVETGTFIGHSSIKMAEGLRANGFGKIVTLELDPVVFAKAKENIEASGLSSWIEPRNESSLEAVVAGSIDLLYIDSDPGPIREQEIRRFLPQVKTRGLILAHDASSAFKSVREAALRLEREGLLSVVLLSTPRGLMIAQKREGRT